MDHDTARPLSRRRLAKLLGAGSLAAMSPVMTTRSAAQAAPLLYKDKTKPIPARVDDLLSRMTLEEKIMQTICIQESKGAIQNARAFSAEKAAKAYPNGLGMLARPQDCWGYRPPEGGVGQNGFARGRGAKETAEYTNAAQKWALEQTRLGIPLLMHEEALHGYTANDATSFPQAIGLASSFDPDLVEQVFTVAAVEMRARGAHLALAPVIDVARDPRWGRIEETYGEDPHLVTEIGKAAVLGLQGRDLPLAPTKVFATLKHMAGHGQPENGTNTGPAELSERVLRETFLRPFERMVAETNVRSIMPSYNEIDGLPSHANTWLLKTVLRQEWGYKGLLVSDYYAIKELVTRHRLAPDLAQAARMAMDAGVDIETPEPLAYASSLPSLIKSGQVSEQDLDASVRRILTLKFEAGLFENPYTDADTAEARTATDTARRLARRAATRTVVLLKNENNLLPLKPRSVGKLLVLGTHANDTPIGGYSETPKYVISILEGLRQEAKQHRFEIDYREGVRITDGHEWGRNKVNFTDPAVNARLKVEALEAARDADTIVMVLGDNEQTSREAWSDAHMGDRQTLDLMGQQNDLASAILDLGKPTIVFLLNGRPLSINLLAERANAIVEGWYMGQETGSAAADILFGRANPGGKLPVSIARHVGQLPIFYNFKPSARRGYLDGTTKPLYPFGWGLSYTTFDISAPRLSRAEIGVADDVIVRVDVKNTGAVAGDEVVQIYVRDEVSSVTRPVLELKAFKRIGLAPGETRTLEFVLGPKELSFLDRDMKRIVEPGAFTVFAGPNSVDLKPVTLTVV